MSTATGDAGSVLISGAAGGIGAATARAFARDGWTLALTDLAGDRLRGLAAELARDDAQVVATEGDLRDPRAARAAVDAAAPPGATLSAVCANAGVAFPEQPLAEISDEEIRTMLDVNLLGAINLLRAAVPRLADGGAVVITSSTSGLIAHPGAAVYAATKLALVGLGRSLAMELAERRIRVNMVCPGGVETELTRGIYGAAIEGVIAEYERENPLGRIAQPEQVADAIVFLAGPRSAHVNGVALRVDGGDGLRGAF